MKIHIHIDRHQDWEFISPFLQMLQEKNIEITIDNDGASEPFAAYDTKASPRYRDLIHQSDHLAFPRVSTLHIPDRDTRNAR
ncbi:MAG: hypothetical protein NWR72_06875 [Bacteroidia bacterium]|nr:hypothetical protein [Bacteroidia bacterium]